VLFADGEEVGRGRVSKRDVVARLKRGGR
jgi:hypothetical protein